MVGHLVTGTDDSTEILSQFSFDPTQWGNYTSITLHAICYADSAFTDNQVYLYNLTDGEIVNSSFIEFDGTTPTLYSYPLTVGSSTHDFKDGAKLYEVRLYSGTGGVAMIGQMWLAVEYNT